MHNAIETVYVHMYISSRCYANIEEIFSFLSFERGPLNMMVQYLRNYGIHPRHQITFIFTFIFQEL